MGREIVSLQVGQAGNQIGYEFWQVISEEHKLSTTGHFEPATDAKTQKLGGKDSHQSATCVADQLLSRIEVYYNEADGSRYVPRALMLDLEPNVIDTCRTKLYGGLFKPDNFVKGITGAGNNWAKGFLTEGNEIIEQALDVCRSEVEACDSLQGFQITHSLGGGTGAGTGTLLLTKLRDEYPDSMMISYPVFPSAKVSEVVVEPYNAMLAIQKLMEHVDGVMTIDNEALYGICKKTLKLSSPKFRDLNHLISAVMAGTTCTLRFPGQLNSDLRKLCVNLIPFPRLHFFSTAFAPLVPEGGQVYQHSTVAELSRKMFSASNMMVAIDPAAGRYLTASAVYRGALSTQDVEDEMARMQDKHSELFFDWIPNSIKASVCDVPPTRPQVAVAATFVGNNTAIQSVFQRIGTQFTSMFRRHAFVHTYYAEGMEEAEFTEAECNLNDLIAEYQQYQDYSEDVSSISEDEAPETTEPQQFQQSKKGVTENPMFSAQPTTV